MYYFSPSEESEKRVGQPRCSFAAAAAKSLQSCPTLCPPTRLRHPWDSPGKNTGVGCHFLLQCIEVKCESEVIQSSLILRDPMDCSLPGSSIHGIFQARVLEWGAIAFSDFPLVVTKVCECINSSLVITVKSYCLPP